MVSALSPTEGQHVQPDGTVQLRVGSYAQPSPGYDSNKHTHCAAPDHDAFSTQPGVYLVVDSIGLETFS